MKPDAIRLAELHEKAYWTHQEMDEAAAELRAQHAVIERLIKIIGETPHHYSLETDREALKIALNALKSIDAETPYPIAKHAIKCINAAFNTQAQPEQDKRPDYCGSGHCSCIECPYEKERNGG